MEASLTKKAIWYAIIAVVAGAMLALTPFVVMGQIKSNQAQIAQVKMPNLFAFDDSSNESKALSDADLLLLAVSFLVAILSYAIFRRGRSRDYRMIGPYPLKI